MKESLIIISPSVMNSTLPAHSLSWKNRHDPRSHHARKAAQLCAATDWRFAGQTGVYIQKVETTPAPLQ